MYEPGALFDFIGYIIIVLTILSTAALIVCLIDRARWKRSMQPYPGTFVIERKDTENWTSIVWIVGPEDAYFTLGQLEVAHPSQEYRVRGINTL